MTSAHRWTDEEHQWLVDHIEGTPVRKLAEAFNQHFGCCLSYEQVRGYTKRKGLKNGCDFRYAPGNVSPTKGVKQEDFIPPELLPIIQQKQFQSGSLPHNTLPVGSEKVVSGYVYVKIGEERKVKKKVNWKPKHHLVYEESVGPIPAGWAVIFIDNNRHNFDPDNLMAVPKRALCAFNRKYKATDDPEINRTHWMLARLEAETNYRERAAGWGLGN